MLLAWLQSGPFGGNPALAKTIPDAWKAALEVADVPGLVPPPTTHVFTPEDSDGDIFGFKNEGANTFGTLVPDTVPDEPSITRIRVVNSTSFGFIKFGNEGLRPSGTTAVQLQSDDGGGINELFLWDVGDAQFRRKTPDFVAWVIANVGVPLNITLTYRNTLSDVNADAIVSDYHRNDWWHAYLGLSGYTGSLNDRELQFWQALFQAATGTAYSAAYSTGYS